MGRPLEISAKFLQDSIEERLDSAVLYGIRRAYKHSDRQLPTDDQIGIIQQEVINAVHDIFIFSDPVVDGPDDGST